MTTFQKVVFMGAVPLAVAAIGAAGVYFSSEPQKEQIIVTGEALKAAKDGKLVIEIVRREENEADNVWPFVFLAPGMILSLAALFWVGTRP